MPDLKELTGPDPEGLIEPMVHLHLPKRARAAAETPSFKALQAQIKNLQAQIEIEHQAVNNMYQQREEIQKLLDATNTRLAFVTYRNKAIMGTLSIQLDALKHSMEIELQTEATNVR